MREMCEGEGRGRCEEPSRGSLQREPGRGGQAGRDPFPPYGRSDHGNPGKGPIPRPTVSVRALALG